MKTEISCAVIQDLLPLYADGLTGEETNEYVHKHIDQCPGCRELLRMMQTDTSADTVMTQADSEEPDFLKRQRRKHRRPAAAAAMAVLLCLSGSVIYAGSSETVDNFQSFAAEAVGGDTFTLGTYEQDGDLENGAEEIVWTVLKNRDGQLTAISKYGLMALPFHETQGSITWEDSSLRSWLNTEFYETAFTEQEKSLITAVPLMNTENPYYGTGSSGATEDLVFLLSEKEAEQLTPDIRIGYPTVSGKSSGISTDDSGHCEWWLRTSGITEGTACRVSKSGDADAIGTRVDSEFLAVRPCIVISYQ